MQRCRAYQVRFTRSGECLRFRFPSGMAFPLRRPEVSEATLRTLQRVPAKAGGVPLEGRRRPIVRKCAGRFALLQSAQFPTLSGTMGIALSF
jgi:hypothetical protein